MEKTRWLGLMFFGAMATVLVAVLALWAWGPIGPAGSTSTANLVWNVEYWHRNAEGEVLQHKVDHNAIQGFGLEAAMLRLIDGSISVTAETDTFDQILLMDTDDTTGVREAANILLNVDGGTGNNAGQAAGGVENNPADGAFTDVGTTSDGDGKVTLQFLADGDPAAATQMQLVKAAVDDTAVGGAADVAEADVLAVIEISVDLADTDTLTITWTIDID